MEYKITEIVREIRESLPEDGRYEIAQAYRAALKPRNVVSLLEERGLLCFDGSSKRPTERGKNKARRCFLFVLFLYLRVFGDHPAGTGRGKRAGSTKKPGIPPRRRSLGPSAGPGP